MPESETTAVFDESATPSVGEQWVVRSGKIFHCGTFKDKEFSMDRDELAAAVADFAPVPVDLSHTSTILDSKLGHLFEVEARGDELHGSVRLPKWLDDLLDAGTRKVSCEWDRATKRLRKLSLVPSPRIEDAVLMAAFSAAHPEEAEAAEFAAPMEIQTLVFPKDKFTKSQAIKWCKDHDFKAEVDETDDSYRMRQADPGAFGEGTFRTKELTDGVKAVMGKRSAKMSADDPTDDPTDDDPGDAAAFADRTWQGRSLLQSIHDSAAAAGAVCRKADGKGSSSAPFHSAGELAAVQAIHDAAIEGGARCTFLDDKAAALYSAAFAARKRHPTLSAAMQHVHDLMAVYPGGCPATDGSTVAFGDLPKQRKAIRAIHDLTTEHGAVCPGRGKAKFGASSPRRPKVGFKEMLARMFARGDSSEIELPPDVSEERAKAAFFNLIGEGEPKSKVEDKAAETAAARSADPPAAVASFADSPEAKALQEKIAELERRDAERAKADEERRVADIKARAAAFARDAKLAHLITPAVEADLAAFAAQQLEDDHAREAKVTFSEAGGKQPTQGGRFDALVAFVAKLPKHGLAAEMMDPDARLRDGDHKVLFNRQSADAGDDLDARTRRDIALLYPEAHGNGSAR